MVDLLVLYILLMLNILIHELTHAIICVLLKKEIVKIRVGEGIGFHIYKFTIGCVPLRGGVYFKYESLKRHERYMIFLSGPIATIILLGWYAIFSHFIYSEILVLQLIIHLFISFLPSDHSDLSNALKKK